MFEEDQNKLDKRATPYVDVEIGALKVKTLIDTGSQISLVTKALYDKFVNQGIEMRMVPVKKFTLMGTFSDKAHIVATRIQIEFKIKEKEFVHKFHIVRNITYDMILGIDFLSEQLATIKCGSEFCLEFPEERYNRISAITLQDAEMNLKAIMESNAELFKGGVGRVNHYKHKIIMTTNRPFKAKTYPVPDS